MPLLYKIEPKKNPQDLTAPPKYYARAITSKKAATDVLAEGVSKRTTYDRAEVYAMLMVLSDLVCERLAEGESIDLLELCIVSPTLSSSGAETEADFNVNSNIRKIGVNIRPKAKLIEAVNKATVQKMS